MAKQGGTEIRKVGAGALAYYEASSSKQLLYNTISTPNGGQYRVTLPDGTSVWLNAASSVTFPTAFTKERAVTITGEVYFDISPDKVKPFIVSTHDIKIKVLGTSFNINAYDNEQSVKTTLVNGSVQVLAAENTSLQQQVLLQPGQQARWAAGASNQPDRKVLSIVPSVELDKVIAWKHGLFDFNGVDLQEQMRQIERWYDVEIVYENGIPDERFVGKIYRSSSLPTLLKAFESANIRFRAAGRKIIVLNDVK
jgi:ferric-dicitrate binding protein FerR (iron transport regulator)